jgi:hypothetical protein
VIVDVEPSTAVRQGELAACRTMVERTEERLGLHPERLTADTAYDPAGDLYRCPGGQELKRYRRAFANQRTEPPADDTHRYRASKADCDACARCPRAPARKVTRSIHEAARDVARDIAKTDAYWTSMRQRKKVEMLFAHLKRIVKLDRLRLRGPCGARDEFLLAATAQNLRKLARLIPAPAPLAPA